MNATHIHLLLNHFPVIGTLLGGMLLIAGIWRKNQSLQNAGAFVLVVMAVLAIPVYLTGDSAEETVENLPGVSEQIMYEHEEAANIAFWLMLFTGLLSGLSLIWKNLSSGKRGYLFWLTAGFAVVSFAAMARAGYYGGQIRHTEIRSGFTAGTEGENGNKENEKEEQEENQAGTVNSDSTRVKADLLGTDSAVPAPKNNGSQESKEEKEEGRKDDD